MRESFGPGRRSAPARCAPASFWRILALGVVALALTGFPTGSAAESGGRTHTLYAVSADADDEFAAWGLIEGRPKTYTVFVTMGRGENTRSCMATEESQAGGDPGLANGTFTEGLGLPPSVFEGPYRYQGPNSPVGEADKGERHPLGNPWQGRGTRACKRARVASWHWFLDDMAELDPSLATMRIDRNPIRDDDFQGRHCARRVGCAAVWANREGARVSFDLGDGELTPGEVYRALRVVRRNRRAWGIRLLREESALAAAYFYDGGNPACSYSDHPDREAVQKALYERDVPGIAQLGVACAFDPRVQEHRGPVAPLAPETLYAANEIDPVTEHRIGPFVVNYGWLWDTYSFGGDPAGAFWERR